MYAVKLAPGWHGEPCDPVVRRTRDERKARLMAGQRVDIKMPGACNRYRYYAVDEKTGEELDRIESFKCDACGRLVEWGDGPIGTSDGRILECPQATPKHLVDWLCESCAEKC